MLPLCPPIYHSLWFFCFPSQHLPLLEIISVCMFIVYFTMRTGTRPIVYKSINIWWMNFISWFPSSNRSFRVDTVKLQHRYQQLQRLVHPDFFSQRSQVAYWPLTNHTQTHVQSGWVAVALWLYDYQGQPVRRGSQTPASQALDLSCRIRTHQLKINIAHSTPIPLWPLP